MQQFLGIWRSGPRPAARSDAAQPDERLTLKFAGQLRRAQRGGIVEYRAGYALPPPREDELTDPQQHEGVFEWLHFDAARDRGRCGTDFLGLGRLYYAATAQRLYFSNDLFLLAKEAGFTDLNLTGCAMLLSIGECVGRDTLIRGIYRLEHGEVLEFDESRYRVRTDWCLAPPEQTIPSSLFVAQSNELLKSELLRTAAWAGPRVCLLSGGDDSRRIAAGLDCTGLDAEYISQRYTGPGGYDEDTIPARMVAECLGKSIEIVDSCSPAEVQRDAEATLLQANAESLSHGWLQKTLRRAPAGSLIYDGLGGDILMNGHYVRKFPSHAKHYHRPGDMAADLVSQFGIKLRPTMRGAVLDAVFKALQDIPESPYRLTLFFLRNHARRGTGSVAMLMRANGRTPHMPFVSRHVAEHSLALDYTEHLKHHYQALATRALNAPLAELPRTRQGVPDEYKINMSHLNLDANKAEARVGRSDFALNARLVTTRDNIRLAVSEILGLHHEHAWRSFPMRKLGLIARVIARLTDENQATKPAFTVEKHHKHG